MPRSAVFAQANRVLRAPEGLVGCSDLPVYTDGAQCISFWEFSYEDWHRAVRQGGVFISVLSGATAPPIMISTGPMFDEPSEIPMNDGVPTDAQTVKQALAIPEIRDMLRQLAAVRSIVGEQYSQDRVLRDVATFHMACDHPVRSTPQLDPEQDELRMKLLEEEVKEFREAVEKQDLVGMADALEDIIYVAVGAKLVYGLPSTGWEEVQSSNMSKLGPNGKAILRADGKVMKGPNYRAPDMHAVLIAAGWTPPGAGAQGAEGTPG